MEIKIKTQSGLLAGRRCIKVNPNGNLSQLSTYHHGHPAIINLAPEDVVERLLKLGALRESLKGPSKGF